MAHSLRRIRPELTPAGTAEPISTLVCPSYGKGISGGQWGQRANIFAGYLQDDWRATENLTINLGLRYEAHTPWIEAHDLQVNFDLFTGQLIAPDCSKVNLGTAPVTCQESELPGSINGTYGLRISSPGLVSPGHRHVWVARRSSVAPTVSPLIWKARARTFASPSTRRSLRLKPWCNTTTSRFRQPLPNEGLAPVGSASDPFAGARSAFGTRMSSPPSPSSGTEQSSTSSATNTIQVGYVGQHGTHLMVPMPYLQRQFLPEQCLWHAAVHSAQCLLLRQSGVSVGYLPDLGHGFGGQHELPRAASRVPEALFQRLAIPGRIHASPAAGPTTAATMATGEHRLPRRIPTTRTFTIPRTDWADCFFDAKHVLSSYAVYEIPFGRGKKFGHDINRVWTRLPEAGRLLRLFPSTRASRWHSTISAATPPAPTLADCGRIAVPGPGKSSDGKQRLVPASTSAISGSIPLLTQHPAVGTFGNCPAQGPVRGPGYGDVDLSMQKNFVFTERVKLQFRSDFLNAFNRVNLNSPSEHRGGYNMGLVNTLVRSRA